MVMVPPEGTSPRSGATSPVPYVGLPEPRGPRRSPSAVTTPGFGVSGLAQDPLGHDVALDLAGAPGDGEATGGQEAVDPPAARCPRAPPPSAPARAMPISWTRCSCSAPSSLRTLASGPGSVPESDRSVARCPMQAQRLGLGQEGPDRQRRPGRRRPRPSLARRRSTGSTPVPKVDPVDIDTRSLARVVRAMAQPPPGAPMTQSSGTKTSVRKTSLNMAAPVSSRQRADLDPLGAHVEHEVGDALVLGDRRVGPGQADAPVGTSGPSTSTPSGRSAPTRRPPGRPGWPELARSDPAPGSLNSWHHHIRPRSVGPTHRSCCSGEPWAMRVGSAQAPTPMWGRWSPARSVRRRSPAARAPRTSRPHGRGQWGATSPADDHGLALCLALEGGHLGHHGGELGPDGLGLLGQVGGEGPARPGQGQLGHPLGQRARARRPPLPQELAVREARVAGRDGRRAPR